MDDEATSDRCADPVTALLADLQAGLLDDDAAARVRHRVRTDPDVAGQLAGLDRVRRDIADLGVDAASAPDVPSGVTARVDAALRAARPPAHQARRMAALAGIVAVVAAGAVGTTMLVQDESAGGTGTAAAAVHATGGIPLSTGEILALLTRPADLGPFADPQRRASCLSGLGYPASTSPMGAQPLAVNGRPGVLVLLPGDTPRRIAAEVVGPNCSSVDTGLLASTVVDRP